MDLISSVKNSYSSWVHFSQDYPYTANAAKKTFLASCLGFSLYHAFKTHLIATSSLLLLSGTLYYFYRKQPPSPQTPAPLNPMDNQDALSALDTQESAAKEALSWLEQERAMGAPKAEKLCSELGIKPEHRSRFRFLSTNLPKTNFPSPEKAIACRKEQFWQLLQNDNPSAHQYLLGFLSLNSKKDLKQQ